MSHGKRSDPKSNTIRHQGYNILKEEFAAGKGESKHRDKKAGETKNKIYSDETLKTYMRAWSNFCDFLEGEGIKAKTLDETVEFVPVYIENLKSRKGKWGHTTSSWTIRTRFSGVAKVLGISATTYELPSRKRENIRRSRIPSKGDGHFSEKNNSELIAFCKTTGLRNFKELKNLRGTDLIKNDDGSFSVYVQKGKGGKERVSELVGTAEEIKSCVERMEAAGDYLVWTRVPSNMDVHSCRAAYATRVYKKYARPIDQIENNKEKYFCRGDMKGGVLDRSAMRKASKALGHNRVNVIAENYLYSMKAN